MNNQQKTAANLAALALINNHHNLKDFGGKVYEEIATTELHLDENVQYNPNGKFGAELIIKKADGKFNYIPIEEGTPMKETFTIVISKAIRDYEENNIKVGDTKVRAK